MSGQAGMRGYFIQAVFSVLEALNDDHWTRICFEPSGTDKIDLQLEFADKVKVSQIKSSEVKITKAQLTGWARDLLKETQAAVGAKPYERHVVPVGPTTDDATTATVAGVMIDTPHWANVPALVGMTAQQLDHFMCRCGMRLSTPHAREVIVYSLSGRVQEYSTHGATLDRAEFEKVLERTILAISPAVPLEDEKVVQQALTEVETGLEPPVNTTGDMLKLVLCPRIPTDVELDLGLERKVRDVIAGVYQQATTIVRTQTMTDFKHGEAGDYSRCYRVSGRGAFGVAARAVHGDHTNVSVLQLVLEFSKMMRAAHEVMALLDRPVPALLKYHLGLAAPAELTCGTVFAENVLGLADVHVLPAATGTQTGGLVTIAFDDLKDARVVAKILNRCLRALWQVAADTEPLVDYVQSEAEDVLFGPLTPL